MTQDKTNGRFRPSPTLSALALAAALTAIPAPGPAAPQACAERDRIVARLAERFGETRQAVGLGANNAVVEVFAASETGTWTITVTLPGGLTCLVASGQAFENLAAASVRDDA